ncbi:MAG: transporter substrate-binding domain-containing protein [Tannerella sp.]|jgi:membrane-bound lytic murein transglycosylase MltF|nr:transporter substrate-binding domain-containing protein [Tannerella sp.]
MFSKKLLLLYIFLLILAIGAMGVLTFLKSYDIPIRDYPEIHEEGVLRIVTEYNQSNYYLSGDKIEGFQYELSKIIAELSGLEVFVYLEMSLEKSFEGLSKNQYDIIARNIPTTSDLKQDYLFIDPIVLDKQVLVQRAENENNDTELIRNHLDLAKKTLYIPQNSPAHLRLQNLQHEIGDTIFIVEDPLYSSEQLIIMVAKGDIDYAVCDQQIARLAQKQLPEIDIRTDISFTQLQSWAIRKNAPVLLDSLNYWFNQIKEDGTFNKIYQEYYHLK